MTPLARTAGLSLALTALVLAFAAAAQTNAYDPDPGTTGYLPWVFALLVGGAIVAIFLFVLWMARGPTPRTPDRPPGAARQRT
jgi:sterol desaturase/sphingolipid hydroxylase (fatty acid hydroxylase superfamily)